MAVKVMRRDRWIGLGILLLAAGLRLLALGIKPAHFDEGVNGWFVDEMTREGFYHYDPTNFHGPLHFYVLFVAQTLLGRHEWALRLPIALISISCVGMMLAFRRWLPERACQLAAGAMAISPGFVFYGRYAIHETWLVFFMMLAAWGCVGLWKDGTRGFLWAVGLGLTGMILTKETFVIHVVAFALAVPCLLGWEKLSASSGFPRAFQQWSWDDAVRVAMVCAGLIVFFYSGALLDWSSLGGLLSSFAHWLSTGTAGETGHEKPWHYWLELLAREEWPAMLGLVASLALLAPRTNRLLRWLAIGGLGGLIVYSAVAYKTPWCLIAIIWPFYLVFGHVAHRAIQTVDPWVAGSLTAIVGAFSFATAWQLNFRDYTDEEEPYVYVQTLPDVEKLLAPLRALAASDPRYFHLTGYVLAADHHPLTWMLGDFTGIQMLDAESVPDVADGDFVLADDAIAEDVESRLRDRYFKEPLRVRGSAAESSMLYLRASTFGWFYSDRTPEFAP